MIKVYRLTRLKLFTGRLSDEDPYDGISRKCSEVGYIGLEALQHLQLRAAARVLTNGQVLITVAAFADGVEPWAAGKAAALARLILEPQFASGGRESFITDTILKGYLRPLFSKSVPGSITETGRKAEYRDHDLERERGLPDESGKTKPWKYEDLRAIPVFSWAISHSDVCFLRKDQHFTSGVLTPRLRWT